MTNENENIIKALGKYIYDSLTIRDKIVTYFFLGADGWIVRCVKGCMSVTGVRLWVGRDEGGIKC